ncbi:helix-turn-helix domain-containing protein [Nocardia sp. NPDC050378]|uniref:helix-turn-helix domain-containing protein n=1 Tax=Nocardia sp. NPDC050378 TaxID=3155400 RepID=UPI0033C40CFB
MTRPPRAFSTAQVAPERRLRAWEEHNAATLIALECRTRSGDEFRAREDNLSLGAVHMARVRSTAHAVERSAGLIEETPTGSVAIFVSLRGEALFQQAGKRQLLRPGDLLVCDADGRFVRGFGQGLDEVALRIDRRALPEAAPPQPGEPLIVRRTDTDPYGRAIARLATRAMGDRGPLPPDEQTIVALVAALVSRGTTRPQTAHRALACAYIQDRLDDPGLKAPDVADAVGISVRQLTRVFAEVEQTVPRYVLARRLELAHSLLTGPRAAELRTATVAYRCGFRSVAHFSQTFHTRFGIAAGEVRRLAAARAPDMPHTDFGRPPGDRARSTPEDGTLRSNTVNGR